MTDANLVLGYLDPGNFLGGDRRARSRSRPSARSTDIAAALGIDAPRRGARHPPHRQHDDGRGGAARLGAARRRPAPLRAVRLWRRGRAARHRDRPPARPPAGHRAAHRRGAVGLGHAGDRSALRDRPHPYRRRAGARRRRGQSACSTRWRPRRWRGCAPPSPGRRAPPRAVDMRYGEQVFEITVPLDDVDWSLRRPAAADRRVVSPPPRGALHLCDARPGERPGQCPGRRLRHPRGTAAGARSAGGAARPARRRAADLPRGLGHGAGLPLRRAGPGTDHRRARRSSNWR